MKRDYHIPVLLNDVIDGLEIKSDGVYVDVTFGGGGHSVEILKRLSAGRLFGFDQDPDAADNVLEDERFEFVPQNFRFFKKFLRLNGVLKVDGILADLGVSSHQFDVPERGFSFKFDGPLDMRMNQNGGKTAAQILNEYEEDVLADVLWMYGEFRNSRRLANAICRQRRVKPFVLTSDLVNWFDGMLKRSDKRNKELARLFQALRIEVNDEMAVLKTFLEDCKDVLHPGGRLVVISYHSLEDRLVKNYIKKGSFDGKEEKDFYGNLIRPFKELNRKVIVPSEEEIELNSRARSAKLRIGIKL